MIKQHPRTQLVDEAGLALSQFMMKYDLTPWEWVGLFLSKMQTLKKHALRYERHGDYETPADEAPEERGDA